MDTLKRGLTITLMVAVLFGGSYWYYTALAGCNVPISYQIGEIDPRFGLTSEEVKNAISSAESLWEDGTDRNLFTAAAKGTLVINFVYDERQAMTNAQTEFEEVLERKETVSENVKDQYQRLVSEYDALRESYERSVALYETKLESYNDEVADWNRRGGAPKDVFERLENTKKELETEEQKLDTRSRELNALVRKINTLGSEGNSLITDYNSLVNEYNDRFSEGGEFTQGVYKDDEITIYEYGSEEELIIVLAHEMGHALGIDHVEGATSVMYHHMEEQTLDEGLTLYDRAAFTESCGTKGDMEHLLAYLKETLEALLKQFR
jgi:myosin heavy subunit